MPFFRMIIFSKTQGFLNGYLPHDIEGTRHFLLFSFLLIMALFLLYAVMQAKNLQKNTDYKGNPTC